jgi:hypothetical protein
MHGDKIVQVIMLEQGGDVLVGTNVSGIELFAIPGNAATTVKDLQEQIATALDCHPIRITIALLEDAGTALPENYAIEDLSLLLVKHDTGLTSDGIDLMTSD